MAFLRLAPKTKIARHSLVPHLHAFFYKQLLYKQVSTRQAKKLSYFSTGLKSARQFETFHFQYLSENMNKRHLINRNDLCKGTNINYNLLLYSCCTIFIANRILTIIFKLLSIPRSSTGIA